MTDTPLFTDESLFRAVMPPRILPDDRARTRRTDPLESHRAGDRSQASIHAVRDAVLTLLRQETELTGSDANRLYSFRLERYGWPQAAWDSPRKRLQELAMSGVVVVVDRGVGRNPERTFMLAPEGLVA